MPSRRFWACLQGLSGDALFRHAMSKNGGVEITDEAAAQAVIDRM